MEPHPWLKPLSRRVGVTVACLAWLGFETYYDMGGLWFWLALAGEPSRWVMEPPGMLLHEWRDGRGLVSHLDFIGRYEVGRFGDEHAQAGAPQSGASR